MGKFDTSGYLVVKISDPHNGKNIGCKCIPARWAENALRDNYLIIRYPEEENSETRVQVKNKEPSVKAWPSYCALIMFKTDSYEKAIEFITESDKPDSPTVADEQPDSTMDVTKASARATPTTSGKRIQSEGNDENSKYEDNLPKKKRKSAIRSSNNLKMLIQNKQLHYFPKQKASPKKVLSLRKEARTETLETLIRTGKFYKLEKLYTKTVESAPLRPKANDATFSTDDSDSDNELEIIPPPDKSILKPVSKNAPNPNKHPGNTKTLRETVIATCDSDSNNEPEIITSPDRNILKLVSKNKPNQTNTTQTSGSSKTPLPEIVIATDDSDSNNEPEIIRPPDRNILEHVSKNELNPTNTTKKPGRSETPLPEIVIATDDSDSNSEPEIIPPPDRNKLEPVSKNEPNPTNTTKKLGGSKTPFRVIFVGTDDSDSNNEPETIPVSDRNISKLEHNTTNSSKTPRRSNTSLRETVDSDPTQISSTNNLDQLKGTKISFKGIQSSLNAEVSTLQNLLHNLAPEIRTEHQNITDIKHIEDIYNSILDVKSKLNAVYQENSVQLRKTFECINLFVPEIKEGLSLPSIQQLKEINRPNSNIPKSVSSRQEPPSHPRTSCLQQSESSSDSESFSQSSNTSTSSKSKSKCSYVAK